jgi:hypothetical protein
VTRVPHDVNWPALAEGGWLYPDDVAPEELADQLGALLSHRDPRLRDDLGYTALARWSGDGSLDPVLVRLGDAAVERLGHPEVQARAFAPLVFSLVVQRGSDVPERLPTAVVDRWCLAFTEWYPRETEVQGWDDELGWLHAVAHGADALAAFAGRLPARSSELLRLAARRMTERETTYRYVQLEDARLARAITEVLSADGLTPAGATDWLDVVDAAFAGAGPGPVPPWAFNTFATLQSLQLHLTRGLAGGPPSPSAPAVAARVARLLRGPYPWLA